VASDTPDVYMRFVGEWGNKPLKGECMDDQHLGEEGWIQIQSFNFGFGAGSTSNTPSFEARKKPLASIKDPDERAREMDRRDQEERRRRDRESTRTGGTWGSSLSGALNFDRFSFNKSTDRMSTALMDMCHDGNYVIPKVEVVAVRYGGTGESFKIPFVRLIFEQVRLRSCKLNLSGGETPSEDVEFEYDKVTLESTWTDNATGNRLPDQPIRAGWDLENQEAYACSDT